jgi:hypothetical protein
MKNTIFATSLFCFVLIASVHAQDSTSKAKTTKPSDPSAVPDEVNTRLGAGKDNSRQPVGVISYDNTSPARLYIAKRKTGRTVLPDRVSLLIKDGYIVDIQVFCGGKIFTNTKAPITLTMARFSKTEFLFNLKDDGESVILHDVVNFISANPFIPGDTLVWLTPTSKSDTLSKNVGVNNVLDLRIYTDALGIFGQAPNGIIQTDARFKQILNRSNFPNRGLFWGQYLKLNFNASKFDSKNSFEDSSHFSRTGLMQKSFINAEVAYNLLSDWAIRKTLSTVYWDVGGGLGISKLAGVKDTNSVITQNIFTEFGLNLKSSSNIGLDLYGRLLLQYSPQTSFNGQGNALWFARFGGEIYWNPFGDEANRIFARINYVFALKHDEKQQQYSQLQLGYSVLLSKLKK